MASFDSKSQRTLTRRTFFRIVTGSLMAMPAAAGGFLVPPSIAYAETLSEADGGSAEGVTERIVVVKASEVGFCVLDMADGGETKVPGAYVRISSRYNGKTVDGYTDPDGVVTLDIKHLAENPDELDVNKLEEYAFNGSMLISCEGYRTCEIPLVRVEGATPLIVPTRRLTDGLPYPRSTTFDEWDVLYTANEFVQTSSNTDTHSIALDWRGLGSGTATVSLKERDTGSTIQSTRVTPTDGTLKASFTGAFLDAGSKHALTPGAHYDLEIVQDGFTYTSSIQLAVSTGAADGPAQKDAVKLTPINTATGGNTAIDAKWPSGVPLVGGGGLKTWSPDLPVNVYINPFGYIQVTLKSPSWGYKRDNGGSGQQGWGTYPRKGVADQFDKMLSTAGKMTTATSKAFQAPGNINQIDLAASVSFMGNFQAVAAAKWDTDKGIFQGMLGGQIYLACIVSITENFFAGPIPVLITFSLNANLTVSLNCGIYSLKDPSNPNEKLIEAAFDFSRWKFDYTSTGLTVTINITPSLSVGVGIRGVASISVMGKFTLTMYMGFTYRGELDTTTHPLPHYIFGYSAQIALVLHLFLFTETFDLKNWKYRDFYDNWEGGLQSMADEAQGDLMSAMANESLPSILSQLHIITSRMLIDTSEFEGSALLTSASEDTPEDEGFDWETMREDDVQAPLDTGTVITYAVYSLLDEDEQAKEQGQEPEGTGNGDREQDAGQQDQPAAPAVSEAETLGADVIESDDDASGALGTGDAQAANVAADALIALAAEELADDGAVEATADASEVTDATSLVTDAELQQASPVDAVKADANAADLTAESPATEGDAVSTGQTADGATATTTRKTGRLRRRSPVVYTRRTTRADTLTALSDDSLPSPGVRRLGVEGGIRPSSDTIIAESVFGDPRVKVLNLSITAYLGVDYVRATCCFRIGSVLVNGEPRTRLIMTVLDVQADDDTYTRYFARERVIDFDMDDIPGISREDLFDYDFDIAFTTYTKRIFNPNVVPHVRYVTYEQVQLVIVSGRRQREDNTPLSSVATDLVFTYLRFDSSELAKEAGQAISYVKRSIRGTDVMGTDGRYHCISSLQCTPDATSDSKVLVISYLDRISSTEEGVLSDNAQDVDIKASFVLVNVQEGTMQIPTRASIDEAMGIIEDAGIYELSLSPNIGGLHTLSLRGLKRTHFFLLGINTTDATFSRIILGGALDSSMHLVAWPQQNCFLTSYPKAKYVEELARNWNNPDTLDRSQWVLQKARWNTQTPVPNMATLVFQPIGPESFNFSNFGINSAGSLIFWPQGKDGDDGRVYNEDGSYEENEDRPVYQIMACRIRNGRFSDPFVAADVEHRMSSLHIVETRGHTAPLEVLGTQQLDPAGDRVFYASNLWYTSVPNLRCATAVGCDCPIPLVSPGGTLRFDVTVRNDGNTYLAGCTLQMCVHEGDKVSEVPGSTAQLTFGKDTLLPSNWNPPQDDGSMSDVEDDWSLAPGKRSVYRIEVGIPGDWQGEKLVSFVARDAWMADDGGLNAMADGDVYQDFSVRPGTYKVVETRSSTDQRTDRTYMQAISVTEGVADGTPYADAPVQMSTEEDTKGRTDPSPKPDKQKTSAKRSGRLAQTGDSSLGALSAGLALGGAALVAYGKRVAARESDEGMSQ